MTFITKLLDFIGNQFGTNPYIAILGIVLIILGGYVGSHFDILWSKRSGLSRLLRVSLWTAWAGTKWVLVWIGKGIWDLLTLKNAPIRIGPVGWKWIFRPTVSALSGLILASVLWGLLEVLEKVGLLGVNSLNIWLTLVLAGLIALYVGWDETDEDGNIETRHIPGTKYGVLLSWFGSPFLNAGIVLKTGDYDWIGKRLRLGWIRKVSLNGTDENGHLKLGDIQIPIWNASDQEGATLLSMIAKNRAAVFGTLMLVIRLRNPRLWTDSDDPTLDIADRARQAYRQIVDNLIDTDVPSVHMFLPRLLRGATIVTAFIGKDTPDYKKGAMARSTNNQAMFYIVQDGQTIEEATAEFTDRLKDRCSSTTINLISNKDEHGNPVFLLECFNISDTIDGALEAVGADLVRATFGDIELSDPVKTAAAQASAEFDERVGQTQSAKTWRQVLRSLLPTQKQLENPGWKLAMTLAAAQDDKRGSIKVTMVPTDNPSGHDNPYVQAGVAAAAQLGANNQ